MGDTKAPLGTADPEARVVSLAAYRAARNRERDRLPLFAVSPLEHRAVARAVLGDDEVAHRERMLRHLRDARG